MFVSSSLYCLGGRAIDPIITVLTALVILAAALLHGIVGFGLAQVAMGLLPLFRDPGPASVVFSMIAVVANARIWWSVRDDFRWKDWAWPVVGLAAGMPAGIYVFGQLTRDQLRLAIGVTLLLGVVLMISLRQVPYLKKRLSESNLRPGWKLGVFAGFLAGVLGGAVAIPGPPMIVYGTLMIALGHWTSQRMKATFTAFFGTLMAYRVASLAFGGAISGTLVLQAAVALPALFVGAWLGILIYRHVPRDVFQWLVLALLTVNAVTLILS